MPWAWPQRFGRRANSNQPAARWSGQAPAGGGKSFTNFIYRCTEAIITGTGKIIIALPCQESFTVVAGLLLTLIAILYEKTTKNVEQHRFFRRFIRQLFSSVIKRQRCHHHAEMKKVIAMVQELGDSIEIIARLIARLK